MTSSPRPLLDSTKNGKIRLSTLTSSLPGDFRKGGTTPTRREHFNVFRLVATEPAYHFRYIKKIPMRRHITSLRLPT